MMTARTFARRSVTLMAVALLGAACGSSKLQGASPTSSPPSATTTTATAPVIPRLAARVMLGQGARPDVLLAAFGTVWVQDSDGTDPKISRIDPNTNKVVATIKTETPPLSLYRLGNDVWVNAGANALRVDPTTNKVTAKIVKAPLVGDQQAFMGVGAGTIWLGTGRKLYRVDPSTLQVRATITLPFPAGRANGDDSMIWVSEANYASQGGNGHTSSIARIDPQTNQIVAVIPVPNNDHVRIGEGAVWASDRLDSVLYRIDPSTNTVTAKIPATLGTLIPNFGDGFVWVGGDSATAIEQIDARTNAVVRSLPAPDTTQVLNAVVLDNALWASGYMAGTVYRFDLN